MPSPAEAGEMVWFASCEIPTDLSRIAPQSSACKSVSDGVASRLRGTAVFGARLPSKSPRRRRPAARGGSCLSPSPPEPRSRHRSASEPARPDWRAAACRPPSPRNRAAWAAPSPPARRGCNHQPERRCATPTRQAVRPRAASRSRTRHTTHRRPARRCRHRADRHRQPTIPSAGSHPCWRGSHAAARPGPARRRSRHPRQSGCRAAAPTSPRGSRQAAPGHRTSAGACATAPSR